MEWIQSIKQTRNLLLNGAILKGDPRFNESCFEKHLKIQYVFCCVL